MANVLIIDDDPTICKMLKNVVLSMQHDVRCALTLKDGLKLANSRVFDVVYLDVRMPDGDGLEALPKIQNAKYPPEVIIMTGSGDRAGAEYAIRNGAWDYIEKPSTIEELSLPLACALQYRKERNTAKQSMPVNREGIVGHSPQLIACFDVLAQAADCDANVLIMGETGTGKELFAKAIHENSPRAGKNFVVVDCTALPETLVESVLFGHEMGAFTGADKARNGLIEQADGGTLFLDEVGEPPLGIQKTFLRVLQEKRFRPISCRKERASNFRLITATNQNLDKMAEMTSFRRDLLYRIRSLTIELPPLRERRDDITDLIKYHIAQICNRAGKEKKEITHDFFEALALYDWPGNVRELVNTLEAALALAGDCPTLFRKHLPLEFRVGLTRDSVGKDPSNLTEQKKGLNPAVPLPRLAVFRESMDKRYLKDLMILVEGNIQKAVQVSGLSRSRLYALLKKHSASDLKFPSPVVSSELS